MKTCPACSEIYSERIDFCFTDGEALVLMPSAMDAPMPRMASAPVVGRRSGLAPSPRVARAADPFDAPTAEEAPDHPSRALPTEEAPPPTEESDPRPPSPPPVPTTLPSALPPPPTPQDLAPDALPTPPPRVAVPQSLPPPPDAHPPGRPVSVQRPPPRPVPQRKEPPAADAQEGSGWVLYFVGAALAALAVVVLLWRVAGSQPGQPTPPTLPAAPALATPVTPPPAAPPVVEPAPAAAPAPALAAPAAAPAANKPEAAKAAPRTPPPDPGAEIARPAPVRASPADLPPDQRIKVIKPPSQTASPWDAPAEAAVGKALITSHPDGAKVLLDGKPKGTTPLSIELPYGSYSVELDLSGYVPVRRRIDVQSPEPKFPHTLERQVRTGQVLVVMEGWDSASLVVDGQPRGQLPASVVLSEGTHTFEVSGPNGTLRLHREVKLADSGLTRLILHNAK